MKKFNGGGTINGVAVDPASDRLLVTLDHLNGGGSTGVREGAIDEFELENGERFGTQITEASQGELLVPTLDEGTAVTSGPDGTVYYASRGLIEEFGPGRFLPSPRLGEPSQRAGLTATLNGAVRPRKLATGNLPVRICGRSGISSRRMEQGQDRSLQRTGRRRNPRGLQLSRGPCGDRRPDPRHGLLLQAVGHNQRRTRRH